MYLFLQLQVPMCVRVCVTYGMCVCTYDMCVCVSVFVCPWLRLAIDKCVVQVSIMQSNGCEDVSFGVFVCATKCFGVWSLH